MRMQACAIAPLGHAHVHHSFAMSLLHHTLLHLDLSLNQGMHGPSWWLLMICCCSVIGRRLMACLTWHRNRITSIEVVPSWSTDSIGHHQWLALPALTQCQPLLQSVCLIRLLHCVLMQLPALCLCPAACLTQRLIPRVKQPLQHSLAGQADD